MKIVFMGSPEFAVLPLNSLLSSRYEVVSVYTIPPKPSGRGQKLTETPIHVLARKNNLMVCTVKSLKTPSEQERFKQFAPDVVVVTAYGLMLPREILDIPKYGCINIHPSLLPRWRGAAPIQHAILSGDRETGISIMQMSEGLDSGPILKQEKLLIEKGDNYKVLHDKLSELGSFLLLKVLSEIEIQIPIEQNDQYSCYAHKIEDYRIYANDNCEFAYRKVKAFYPKAFVQIDGKRIKILDADFEVNNLFSSRKGEIIHDMCITLTGGLLIPKVVQMEGRKACDIKSFMCGLKSTIKGRFIE